jgi:tetratricopeptide (TPR) repeat protein/HEAT repeat protein
VALVLPGTARSQDFDPHGRHHPPPARPNPTRPSGNPGTKGGPPTGGEGASQAALIDRYTKVVLAQPGSPFPLQRLAQLYRDKDGNLAALISDFQKRAAQSGAEQYAAVVTLAGIAKLDGRAEDAIKTYEQAIVLKPSDPTALLALARVLQDRGDTVAARGRYESALSMQTLPADREQTLRTLMGLALDGKDWDAAKKFHSQLVKQQPTSLLVRGELGRELYARGEFERAEAEFKELVTAATGDNRTLAPALKELGRAQAKAHKNAEALATLKRALSAAGSEAAVRAEIYETITEVYRADQQLPTLIKQLEDEHPNDFARLKLLGSLYEETGDAANALVTYRKALTQSPRDIDLRLKLIRLLQSQGELDKAIAEYDGVIRAAPNNPQFVFEQCDALLQRGDRARALRLLMELEARASSDEEVLSRLSEFYARIGEGDRSLKVLTRLSQVGSNDPSHLVDLGDRYFQDGNTTLAVSTWKRILTTVTPRARALAAIGDVYLEHEMLADALVALREAVQLDSTNVAYKKQLASALERARNFREAHVLWQELANRAKQQADRALAREARTHMVTLWGLERVIEQQVAPLTAQFNARPPDVEAGRTLAEVLVHLRRLPETEATLGRVIELAPGDAESYLALERVLVQETKLQEAIAVLEKLVQVDPKRARELYQRMAQYALQLYKDDDAIKYAARAVELNPDDAEGHRRLGEMYRSRQDVEHAIVEFRAAIAKNDRLYIVYFELADLLLSRGQTDEADRLFRRVLRGAPDEELVARAARLSMQINLGRGTLESLEQELLPLAIGNPQRTIFRRLLVEIYGNLTFGLVQRLRHGAGKDADEARSALAHVGQRAVKPLLDALADGDGGQQRVAIDVLGYVQNKNAGPALFSFATGPAETPLRVRAMIACGALKDPALLPRYDAFLFPKDGHAEDGLSADAVAVAASWGLARMADRRAVPLLRAIVKRGTPEMRALAVLGLGLVRDKSSLPEVARLATAVDAGNVARAAAAYALGELSADAEAPTLVNLAQGTDALPRQMALLALAKMRAGSGPGSGNANGQIGRAAIAAMADAAFAGSDPESPRSRAAGEAVQRAGSGALIIMASGRDARATIDPLPVPDGGLEVDATLEQLVPTAFTEKERATALLTYGDAIQHAAIAALTTSSDRARAVLDALSQGDGALAPFVDSPPAGASMKPSSPAAASVVGSAQTKAREVAKALEPSIIALARHPDATIRTKAIVLLARSGSDAATAAVVQATSDSNETVQRVALSAIGSQRDPKAVTAVGKVLEQPEGWALRVLAAQAMGRLGAAGDSKEAAPYLRRAAERDGYALVREAALKALATFDSRGAKDLALVMERSDPEPRVRDAAHTIAVH